MADIDALPDHIRRPDMRPVQPVPVMKDGQQLFALRDPGMYNKQTMVVPPQALMVLQQFRGEQSIDEIARQFRGDVQQFVQLAQTLDGVGLLWGPTFDKLESDLKSSLEERGAFAAGASASMGQDDDTCRRRIESYFEQTEDPELDARPVGIIAPHLDYDRGWPNYAAAYYLLRSGAPPDRVIVLGTNHFGVGDGVVLTEFGFESPMGRCPCDSEIVGRLQEKLGPNLIVDQLDHVGEHSIQLQLPWLQYCFGNVPIVAALIPDPLVPMIENDGKRIEGPAFVQALTEVLDDVGGLTQFIASSDLSHVGPQFGEPRPVDEQRRLEVEQHDREMLGKFMTGDAEDILAAMRWNKNSTRWCSLGNMTAALQLARPSTIELIDYRQAFDERGIAMVSSAALVMY